jgi:hypothetical protein
MRLWRWLSAPVEIERGFYLAAMIYVVCVILSSLDDYASDIESLLRWIG